MSLRTNNEGRHSDGSSRMPFIGSGQPTSPDPVEIVRQYEEDENLARILQEYQGFDYIEEEGESARVARQLQAQFDSEILSPPHTIESRRLNDTPEIVTSEDNIRDIEFSDHGFSDPETRNGSNRDLELVDFADDEEEDDDEVENIHDVGFSDHGFSDPPSGDGSNRDLELVDFEEDADDEDDAEDDDIDDEGDDIDEEEDEIDDDEDEDEGDHDEGEEEGEVDRSRLFPEEIERLPTQISRVTPLGGEQARTCQICMDTYATGDELRRMPCFHEFHTACIDPWLLTSTTCPVCRCKVVLTERVR